MVEDAGRGWRKVVASPKPRAVRGVEIAAALINRGHIVVAAGGGGIPVVISDDGEVRGVEAVIDKDYAASMLAASLSANLFIILTGVDRVSQDFGKPTQAALSEIDVPTAKRLLAEGQFPPGQHGAQDRRGHPLRRGRRPRGPGHARRIAVGGSRGQDRHLHSRRPMSGEAPATPTARAKASPLVRRLRGSWPVAAACVLVLGPRSRSCTRCCARGRSSPRPERPRARRRP